MEQDVHLGGQARDSHLHFVPRARGADVAHELPLPGLKVIARESQQPLREHHAVPALELDDVRDVETLGNMITVRHRTVAVDEYINRIVARLHRQLDVRRRAARINQGIVAGAGPRLGDGSGDGDAVERLAIDAEVEVRLVVLRYCGVVGEIDVGVGDIARLVGLHGDADPVAEPAVDDDALRRGGGVARREVVAHRDDGVGVDVVEREVNEARAAERERAAADGDVSEGNRVTGDGAVARFVADGERRTVERGADAQRQRAHIYRAVRCERQRRRGRVAAQLDHQLGLRQPDDVVAQIAVARAVYRLPKQPRGVALRHAQVKERHLRLDAGGGELRLHRTEGGETVPVVLCARVVEAVEDRAQHDLRVAVELNHVVRAEAGQCVACRRVGVAVDEYAQRVAVRAREDRFGGRG